MNNGANKSAWWRTLLNTQDTLRPTLLVTWAVPVERVRLKVPAQLELDTIRDENGEEIALLSVAALRNIEAGPVLFPRLNLNFLQANYRTYIKHDGKPFIYFFGNFVENRIALIPPLLYTPNAYYAPGRMRYEWLRKSGKPTGWRLRFQISNDDLGDTRFTASGGFNPAPATLFGIDEINYFITHRLAGYYTARGGGVGRLAVDHVEMQPWSATLHEIRCDPWLHWGLLDESEIDNPVSAMLQHEIAFTGTAPERILANVP